MIGLKATMLVIDNSGALLAECVNVLKNKSSFGLASTGDEVVVVIKKARPLISSNSAQSSLVQKVKRGDVRRAIIVRTKKEQRRPDGRYVRFDDNACVLLNSKREPLGSRINGVVSSDLRTKGWSRIASLATRVV